MSEVNRLVYSVEVTEDKIHIIHLKDVFDPSTVEEFEHVIDYLFANKHYKIIVDLSRVEFVSSAGWGTCTGELNTCREHNGDIVLVGMQPEVFDVFMLLELDTFIMAFHTVEDALRQFRSKRPEVQAANRIVDQKREAMSRAAARNGHSDKSSHHSKSTRRDEPERPPKLARPEKPPIRQDLEDILDDEELGHLEISEDETLNIDLPEFDDEIDEAIEEELPKPAKVEQKKEEPKTKPVEHKAEQPAPQEKQEPVHQPKPAAPPVAPKQPELQKVLSGLAEAREEAIQEQPQKRHFFDAEFYFGKPMATFEEQPEPRKPAQPTPSRPMAPKPPAYSQPQNRMTFQRPAAPQVQSSQKDDLLEKIISVVIANPSYGPSSIRQVLINMNLASHDITRSTVFKKLNDSNLSTRSRREEFARAHRL